MLRDANYLSIYCPRRLKLETFNFLNTPIFNFLKKTTTKKIKGGLEAANSKQGKAPELNFA